MWTSDLHIGLVTDEIERTDEIIGVLEHVFKHALKIKADAVVLGGDIFHNNTPNEHLIAMFIHALNILNGSAIKIYVMVGNHDAIAKHSRKSCLSFLHKIEKGYPNVRLIDRPLNKRMFRLEAGDVYFTFLPFIRQAHVEGMTVQQCMDKTVAQMNRKLEMGDRWFVFSHLNVPGVIPGTEETMLKRVDVQLPKLLMETRIGGNRPTVIQGHIHTKQDLGNVHIVGSPVFVDFGEKEKQKYFLEIDIPEKIGEGPGGLKYLRVPCLNFVEFNLHASAPDHHFGIVGIDSNSVVKVNLTLDENAVGFDVEELRSEISKVAYYVKPIYPKILRSRVKRNTKQTVQLSPDSAVKQWLKANRKQDAKRLYKIAKQYVGEVL